MKNSDNLVKITFKGNRRGLGDNQQDLPLNHTDIVIVEAERGLDCATAVINKNSCGSGCSKGCSSKKSSSRFGEQIFNIRRVANRDDLDRLERNREKEKNAFKICKERIAEYKLQMKLVDVEMQFDGSKMIFYFTADQRVDFRELVKTLASIYRTRIELRQIGVRDEAKRLGGVGICGKSQCCSSFMSGFSQITTQFAKDQQLSLNPTKISGNCGRLLCCLQFEEEDYLEAYKTLPRSGSSFINGEGKKGDIVFVDTFKERIQVRRFENGINRFDWYDLEELKKGEVHEQPDRQY